MEVTKLPFNKFIGLQKGKDDYLISLPTGEQYTNHLGTVHASALFAVAEAASGEYLLGALGSAEGYIPVVRNVEIKFKKPAKGSVSAKASVNGPEIERIKEELLQKGRALIKVNVEVVDELDTTALTAVFEWFIAKEK